jgi:hypothetical protein
MKKITDNGIHYVHYIAPSKVLIIFSLVLSIVMITMLAYQQKEIETLRVQVNEVRSAWLGITGEML